MERPRPDTLSPEPRPLTPTEDVKPSTYEEDDRIVFSAWDAPLVPSPKRGQ